VPSTRARQADDEYGIVLCATDIAPRSEKLPGTSHRLPHCSPLDRFDIEASLAFLQRVAALVIAEGLRELGPILERLAQRETQMVPVGESGLRSVFVSVHARDLVVGESIRLEVRQAPIRIAEIRSDGGSSAIGVNGLGLPTQCLQRMPDR
jgi:hypothetical protein